MEEDKNICLRDCYDNIIELIQSYVDIDEKYLPILSLWVIGTYLHSSFRTYPYLYINATKSGGKTRLLSLLAFLSNNGRLNVDLTEAVLFREADKNVAFFIDELENITRKEKATLRLLLDSAYKKGISVTRTKKNPKTEDYEVLKFNLFTPIAMANIWGMDNVLQDRCITIILEKSVRLDITRKIEIWDIDPLVLKVKNYLEQEVSVVSAVSDAAGTYTINTFPIFWNTLLQTLTHKRHTTLPTLNSTNNTNLEEMYNNMLQDVDWLDINNIELNEAFCELGRKIWLSSLSSRDLELFFPLIFIAHETGKDILDNLLTISDLIVKERKIEEITESRDSVFLSFLLNYERAEEWIKIIDLTKAFKFQEEEDYIRTQWIGRALKRLNLFKQKKRLARGREVIIDWPKIDQKAKQLGIERVEPEEKEEAQTDLKEQPDWQDRKEAGEL